MESPKIHILFFLFLSYFSGSILLTNSSIDLVLIVQSFSLPFENETCIGVPNVSAYISISPLMK